LYNSTVESIIVAFLLAFIFLFVVNFVVRKFRLRGLKEKINDLQCIISENSKKIRRLEIEKQLLERKWSPAFSRFVAIDIETTGLKAASSRIIQIALVLFADGKANGKRVWWIDPGVRIPPNATKVNRITNEQVRGRGSFRDHCTSIQRLAQKYPLVGHNLYFDMELLRQEFLRMGMNISLSPLFCTMTLDWRETNFLPPKERHAPIMGEFYIYSQRHRWKRLGDLADELGVCYSGQLHDAFTDARLAGECFIALAVRDIENIKQRIAAENLAADKLKKELDLMKISARNITGLFW
jgi:DNA polymerase-3 subunit epsilon